MFDIAEGSSFGSSFVPLWKFAPTQKVEAALKYWCNRWNMNPETLYEYMYLNDLKEVPKGDKITLYHKNKPYQVLINNKSQIVIPYSEIKYVLSTEFKQVESSSTTINQIILDPVKMTISGFTKKPYVKRWKVKTGRKRRAFGYEWNRLYVNLGPFFEFEQDIIKAFFRGDGMNFLILNNIDTHTFNIDFVTPPEGSGKRWNKGPYMIELQRNLKVKLS